MLNKNWYLRSCSFASKIKEANFAKMTIRKTFVWFQFHLFRKVMIGLLPWMYKSTHLFEEGLAVMIPDICSLYRDPDWPTLPKIGNSIDFSQEKNRFEICMDNVGNWLWDSSMFKVTFQQSFLLGFFHQSLQHQLFVKFCYINKRSVLSLTLEAWLSVTENLQLLLVIFVSHPKILDCGMSKSQSYPFFFFKIISCIFGYYILYTLLGRKHRSTIVPLVSFSIGFSPSQY